MGLGGGTSATTYPGWRRFMGTPISHRTLPLRLLVMNRAGTRMVFQVSPPEDPTSRWEPDLSAIRCTVVFLHGQLFLSSILPQMIHNRNSCVRWTRRRNQPEGQELLQPTEIQNRPLRSAWCWKIYSVRRYRVFASVCQHLELTTFPFPGARVSRKIPLGTWSSTILLCDRARHVKSPIPGMSKGSGSTSESISGMFLEAPGYVRAEEHLLGFSN